MRLTTFLLGLLLSGSALAEPDTFWLGSGRSGPLSVTAANTVINRYAQLTASAAAGTKELSLSNSTGFVAGELVLLHQSTDLTPAPPSGAQAALHLDTSTVGQFEYARVETVSPGALRLTAPLLNSYPMGVSQVVSVPEYTDVQVLAGASLQAVPWDGSVGGILAMLVSGTLTNDGLVSVDSAGFRGGVFRNHTDIRGCTALDLPALDGGSDKGEGLVVGRYGTASGRGNLANGGGGGDCHNSGGGGGGHAGMGGQGALSSDGEQAGGLGGASVAYLPHERIVFGGGGGAGEGNDNLGTSGGAGGGLMLLRAGAVAGAGSFSAKGFTVPPTPGAGDDGAGGGGAGGAISLRTKGALTCGVAEASGGAGGDISHPTFIVGPGGGGGGGVVFMQGEPLTCPRVVLAGAPGRSMSTGDSRGAGPDSLDGGSAYGVDPSLPLPLRMPATPTLVQPANGAPHVEQRARFEGVAEQDIRVHLFLDGLPYASVVASGPGGGFVYTPPSELPLGSHELSASAEFLGIYSLASAPHRFDVVARPILVVPAEDEQVDPTPLIAGTSLSGVSVSLDMDGAELARVPVDTEGRFAYTLTAEQALAPGRHQLVARFWDAAGRPGLSSPATSFEVVKPTALDVSCGCGASPSAGLGAVALLLGAWASRRRHVSEGAASTGAGRPRSAACAHPSASTPSRTPGRSTPRRGQ